MSIFMLVLAVVVVVVVLAVDSGVGCLGYCVANSKGF
jgi:hypothetical protein